DSRRHQRAVASQGGAVTGPSVELSPGTETQRGRIQPRSLHAPLLPVRRHRLTKSLHANGCGSFCTLNTESTTSFSRATAARRSAASVSSKVGAPFGTPLFTATRSAPYSSL